MDLVESPVTVLDDWISLVHAPGHTPGSMAVHVATGAEPILLVGDAIANPAQLTEPAWHYVWDMEPEDAERSRRRLVALLPHDGWLGVAHCGLGRVAVEAGQPDWLPS